MATPETCKYDYLLCTECLIKLRCTPVDPKLESKEKLATKKEMPEWLKSASKSVRRSYGF